VEVDVVSLAAEFPNDNPALHRGVSWVCLEPTGRAVAIAHPDPLPVLETSAEAEVVCSMSAAEIIAALPAPASEPEPEPRPVPVVDVEVEVAPEIPIARVSEIVGLGETPREADDEPEDDHDEEIVVEELPPLDETVAVEGLELEPEHQAEPLPAEKVAATMVPPASDEPWITLVSAFADVAIGAGSPHVASVLRGLLVDGTLETMPDDAMAALAEGHVVRDGVLTAAFVARTRAWRDILLGTGDDFAACGSAPLDEWGADLIARLLGAPTRAPALKRELRSRGVAAFGLACAA
jgi:hypothetical protein